MTNQRRYYLHYRLRKQGFTVNTRCKTIDVPHAQFDGILDTNKYVAELKAAGYGVQSIIQ